MMATESGLMDPDARTRYELDRAKVEIHQLKLGLWDEYFKAAIIATACTASDIKTAAYIADAALAERVKRANTGVGQ